MENIFGHNLRFFKKMILQIDFEYTGKEWVLIRISENLCKLKEIAPFELLISSILIMESRVQSNFNYKQSISINEYKNYLLFLKYHRKLFMTVV